MKFLVLAGLVVGAWIVFGAVGGLAVAVVVWPEHVAAPVLSGAVAAVVTWRLSEGRRWDAEREAQRKDVAFDAAFANAFHAQEVEDDKAVLTALVSGELGAVDADTRIGDDLDPPTFVRPVRGYRRSRP